MAWARAPLGLDGLARRELLDAPQRDLDGHHHRDLDAPHRDLDAPHRDLDDRPHHGYDDHHLDLSQRPSCWIGASVLPSSNLNTFGPPSYPSLSDDAYLEEVNHRPYVSPLLAGASWAEAPPSLKPVETLHEAAPSPTHDETPPHGLGPVVGPAPVPGPLLDLDLCRRHDPDLSLQHESDPRHDQNDPNPGHPPSGVADQIPAPDRGFDPELHGTNPGPGRGLGGGTPHADPTLPPRCVPACPEACGRETSLSAHPVDAIGRHRYHVDRRGLVGLRADHCYKDAPSPSAPHNRRQRSLDAL